MMITALFCLTLALVAQTKGNDEVKLSEYVLQDPSVHGDLLFTDNVSFDANTKSKLDCARVCASTMNCASFTYRRSAVTSCRGYTEIMTSNSSRTQATGAQPYALKKGEVGPPVLEGYVHDALTGMTYRLYPERATNFSLAVAACEAAGESLIMLETEEKMQALVRGGIMGTYAPGTTDQNFYFVGLARITNYTKYSDPLTYVQENFVWIRTGQPVGSAATHFLDVFTFEDFVGERSCVICYKDNIHLSFTPSYCDTSELPVPFFCEIV